MHRSGVAVAIGYTSGSTGMPNANVKTLGQISSSNAHNDALLRSIGRRRVHRGGHGAAAAHVRHGVLRAAAVARRMSRCTPRRPFFPRRCGARAGGSARAARAGDHAGAPARAGRIRRCRCRRWRRWSRPPRRCRWNWRAPRKTCSPRRVLEVFGSTETCVFAIAAPPARNGSRCITASPCIRSPMARWSTRRNCAQPVTLADIVEPVRWRPAFPAARPPCRHAGNRRQARFAGRSHAPPAGDPGRARRRGVPAR